MERRKFITLLGGAAAAWPLAAPAQHGERVRQIGVLLPATADDAVRLASGRHTDSKREDCTCIVSQIALSARKHSNG